MPPRISKLKLALIFLSASSRKLSGNLSFKGQTVGNAGFAIAIQFAIMLAAARLIFPAAFTGNDNSWKLIFAIPAGLSFVIEVYCRKEIETAGENYSVYYPKWLFYLFILFALPAVVYLFTRPFG